MTARTILLNPGPVTLTERVRRALTEGDWCHREPEFAALVQGINAALIRVHPALAMDYESVLLTGSGTAAVEGMLAAFAPRERTTLVLANGVYGERMARMLAAQGRPVETLRHEWAAPLDLPHIEQHLAAHPEVSHIAVVQHETTTGRLNDLQALAAVARRCGVQLLVDAVSSFGAEELLGREWNVAALAATANKCLHGVAGLSFVLARRELWTVPPTSTGSVYFDLHAYHRAQHADGFSPFTQAVQVAFALREALAEHAESGGTVARRQLYRRRAETVYAALGQLGVTTLLAPAEYSVVLWSYRLPAGMTYLRLHDALKQEGFVIYAGQGHLAPDVFRIAHMGDIGADDLARLTAALSAAIRPR